jgi:uncharacterized membrane protein YeaQ/YmgE (transglycosylase-associated protein family)
MGIFELVNTLFVLSSLVVVASEYASKYTKVKGTLSQIQSWVISILIGIFCAWLNFGIFNGVDTKGGILYGILIGLISNGIFDMSFVKQLLTMIGARTNTLKD